MAKVQLLAIPEKILCEIFQHLQAGTKVRLAGLPEDAEFNGAAYDFPRATFLIRVHSATYPDAAPGSELPQISPTIYKEETPWPELP